MLKKIQLKRGTASNASVADPTTAQLAPGEIGYREYNTGQDLETKLFIGGVDGNSVREVGGTGMVLPVGTVIPLYSTSTVIRSHRLLACIGTSGVAITANNEFKSLWSIAISYSSSSSSEHGYFYRSGGNRYTPDLRGYFIRGGLGGQDADGYRNPGNKQWDSYSSHNHTYDDWNRVGTTQVDAPDWLADERTVNYGENNTARTTGSSGGNENRPRNIALTYYIKY